LIGQPWTGQPRHDSRDRIPWTRKLGQVILDRLAGNVSQIISAWRRQRNEDGQNMAARTELGQDNYGMTASTGQQGQDSKDRTAGT
jgi:hypothetical protein